MIESIKILPNSLRVRFKNKYEENYPNIWLRDHTKDERNWDKRSHQRKTFTASLDLNIKIKEAKAKNSEQAAKEAFSGNSLGSNLPSVNISLENIDKKINVLDFILLSKLENSKSEIRRLIKGNAIKINDNTISDEKFIIDHSLFKENYLKLSIGKKRHIKVELN